MKWAAIVLTVLLLLVGETAMAKRLAGGKSIGRQSGNVSQREVAPATLAPPAPPSVQAPAAAPAVVPLQPRSPWRSVLGGAAAGLGLVWLASSLGMGESFGSFLVFVLFAGVVLMLVAYSVRSRRNAAVRPVDGVFAFQGASNLQVGTVRPYRPENVGNDASARPFERSNLAALGDGTASAPDGSAALLAGQPWGVPADFDTSGFLRAAKSNFVALQAAWDRADIPVLRSMMTDAMLDEIRLQLTERELHAGTEPNSTDVVMLEARMLGIEDLPGEYLASVEFSGMIREDPSAGSNPFREVWNMSKSKDGSTGWLVAGVQALQ